ncbi:hypothetical protein J4440_00905 [Candidatus Woesearchaeota archaeon]|nr:hypothetical protein [Candidatus Woesearchaeota archaeon]
MNLRALNFSTIFTMVLITLMTIFGELYKPLKDFLAKIGTHHWIGKGITALIFFIILYLALTKLDEKKFSEKSLYFTLVMSLILGFIIFIFFIWEYLK